MAGSPYPKRKRSKETTSSPSPSPKAVAAGAGAVEQQRDDFDDDEKKKKKKKKTKGKTKIKSHQNDDEETLRKKNQTTTTTTTSQTTTIGSIEEKEKEEENDEKKITPREWFALLVHSSSRYREHLERLKCDDRNEKEEEEEKALDDSFSEEEEEVEKKKGDDDEKKKKKRKGVEKEEDGDEQKREEITPYNALDSGSLLFEDMWNVRSRAMEEYTPAEITANKHGRVDISYPSKTISAGPTGTARERLKKINRFEKKEEGEEGDAWTKEFDGIETLAQLLIQKKSHLSKILEPVCHNDFFLKEPTTSEQLSRLPHSHRFTEIYERGSTTEERVERLKMIAYVLNLKLPGDVCQKRTSSHIRAFQGLMKEVLTRLKSLAFACARHELFDAVEFLSLESNLVTKEMTREEEQINTAREITLQNAQILTAVMAVMISLIGESNEKEFQTWQKLEYTGHASANAEARKTTSSKSVGTTKLDFDSLKRLARTLRKKLYARNTITAPWQGEMITDFGAMTNKKEEGALGKRSRTPIAAAGGQEPDDEYNELEGMEHDQAMKGDGTKLQQQTTTTKIATASLLTHCSYLFTRSDMRLEDSDIIGRCIYSIPIVSLAVSRFRAYERNDSTEGIKIHKAFSEVYKLGSDIVSRLCAMAGDIYGTMLPKNLDETFFTSGEKVIVAENLSRWYAPDFIESKEVFLYSESVQMQDTYEYGQWLLMPHSETKAAFCRKLVAFFVAAQHDGFFGNFHPLPRKDICRTLCILKYHKHLVDGIKRDYVDRLYSPTEESGNVEASLPMRDRAGQYGPILYKLIAKLSILKEMAKETTENLASSTAVRENKCGDCAELIVKETNILPLLLQLLRDIPSDAIILQKATGGHRFIALDLELASLFGALLNKKEQVRAEVLKYEEGAFVPLIVTRLLDMLSPQSSSASSSLSMGQWYLENYENAMCASPTYWMKRSLWEQTNLKNQQPKPGMSSYQTARKKGAVTAEIIQCVSECVASMNGKIREINDELDKRDFSSVLLKLLERKEGNVKESVSAAIIAMGEHKKIIGKIEHLIKSFGKNFRNSGNPKQLLSVTERDGLKSMMRSVTELVKETPTVPDVINRVVSQTRMARWMERLWRESEEHIYDNMKNTEEGMAKLKSFEEEYSKGTLVNWRTLRKEADLNDALKQIVGCSTSEVLKFRSCYDDEDQNIKKTKLYKSVRVYARIFRAKVAVGSLGLPEGNPSTDVDASDPTFLATGKYPSVLELNLVETIISALAHTRLEDACDVMVDEGMVESVKSLIQVLCEINDRVATLLDVVKDEKDPRIVSVSEVLKEACYCMSLLASKSCHQDRVADAGVIPVLVQIISNFNSKQKEKPHDPVAITSSVARRAADAITNLAHENHAIKSTVRHDGGIPPLISLLHCVHDVKVQRAAAAALRTLAFKNPENKNQIVEEGALKMLLFMVRSEDSSVHKEAVGVIGNLVHSSLPIKKRVLDEGALQPVIGLLSSSCLESQREAALLLGQFAATEPKDYNMTRIVQRGAIAPLVEMLKNSDPGLREMAAFALGRLAQNTDNQIGICFGTGIGPLLKLLDSNIDDIMLHLRETNSSVKKPDSELKVDARRYVENLQHNAAFALYGLSDNEDNVHVIIAEGSVQRFRDATLLLEASTTCVQKTLQRLEDKLTLDKNKKCREYLQYLMTTEPKHAKKFRIAVAFAHLCNKKDMQDIFLESGGLKILIDVLIDHAWNKTGHKSSENGVSFSRPGTTNIEPRRYFLKSLAFTKEIMKYDNPGSDFNKSIVAITEKLANVQKLHGHCLTASSLLPSGATGANVRETIEAISSIVEKTKRDGLGNNGPEVFLDDDEFMELDGDDAANEIVANKYVSEISTQFFPKDNGEKELFKECLVVMDGGEYKVRLGDRMSGIPEMKMSAKTKNLDLCDVVFVCAYGRLEYHAHRIAFAHASEKFLKLIEAGCLHVKNTRNKKKEEKVFGAMVDEEEDPARMVIDDDDDADDDDDDADDDDDGDDADDDDNEKDNAMCRVKLDCSQFACEQLLYYLYSGTFTGVSLSQRESLPSDFSTLIQDYYFEVLNLARKYDLAGLVREVEVSFKGLFTVQNYLRIMYHPLLEKSEVITKLGWQFAFEKRNVHKIIELHGMNYYTMMMHDDEEKLTSWLSDRIKNARDFTQGDEQESEDELPEEDGEGPEEEFF